MTCTRLGRWGRLGNQMFQVAFLLGVAARRGLAVKIPRGSEVEAAFALSPSLLLAPGQALAPRGERWERSFAFDPTLVDAPDGTDFAGYFQSERYFAHARAEVRQAFRLRAELAGAVDARLSEIEARFPGLPKVALHVRRGDYVGQSRVHPPCEVAYYEAAVRALAALGPCVYVVSSDDPAWCREHLGFLGSWYQVEGLGAAQSLALMSRCDHFVIANSSFSWWSAWLGEGPRTIVIAPARWFGPEGPREAQDLLPERWQKIEEGSVPHFKIVVPAFQARRWVERCISSIRAQTHRDFRCLVIDDASSDGTFEAAQAATAGDARFQVVRNDTNVGALANLLRGFADLGAVLDPDAVLVPIDGDDWLATNDALARVASAYAGGQVWLTYGSFVEHPAGGHWGAVRAYPAHVIEARDFRAVRTVAPSHLRTFRAHLWNALEPRDLVDPQTGEPWHVTWDLAVMLPMLEMAGARHRFVPEVIYTYNLDNPLGDSVVRRAAQQDAEERIRAMPKRALLDPPPQAPTWWDRHGLSRLPDLRRWAGDAEAPSRVAARQRARAHGHRSVLDVGCGLCVDAAAWRAAGLRYRGVEPAGCLAAVGATEGLDLVLGHAEAIPEPDGSHDLVVMRHLIEHLPGWRTPLDEAIRVARSEVLVTFFLPPSPEPEAIDWSAAEGLYHNRWDRRAIDAFLSAHPRVRAFEWLPVPPREAILSVELRPAKGDGDPATPPRRDGGAVVEEGRVAAASCRRREIWVASYPSYYGGADTELDHQISLWLAQGVEVHLVPNATPDPAMLADVSARGAVTHTYRPGIFADKVVVSYCNVPFLERLPQICDSGRPRAVVWVNCMTWTSPAELDCHRRGLIDLFAFQSGYQRSMLVPALSAVRAVSELEGYRPFFDVARWERALGAPAPAPEACGYYGVGRVSRDDVGKYPTDLWRSWSRMTAPRPIKCFVLGWGPNAIGKCGLPPPRRGLDWVLWPPGAVPATDLYRRVHTLLHQTGGSRENWPRVAFEAWASGVAVVAERAFAWPELIEDGETGLLAGSSDELAHRASQLAFDDPARRRIADTARRRLLAEHASAERSFEAWGKIL